MAARERITVRAVPPAVAPTDRSMRYLEFAISAAALAAALALFLVR